MSFTPGPWEQETYSDGTIQIIGNLRQEDDGEDLVYTTIMEEVSYQNGCNARLIAAAPELLEAPEEAESLMRGIGIQGGSKTAIEKADEMTKVIAKARGEGV